MSAMSESLTPGSRRPPRSAAIAATSQSLTPGSRRPPRSTAVAGGRYDRDPRPGYKWDIDSRSGRPRQILLNDRSTPPNQCKRGTIWIISATTLRPKRSARPLNKHCDCRKCVREGWPQRYEQLLARQPEGSHRVRREVNSLVPMN